MKLSIVYTAAVLSGTAFAAIGGGYEHGEHGSSTVFVGSSTATEVVISTEINSPTGASEVVSEGTTHVSVTLNSAVTETATGIPGTALHSQKSIETVTSSVVSETTASVVITQATTETAISTSTSEEVKVPSTISTSTSTYTVVVTGSTSYSTVTATLSYKPTTTSKALSVSTAAAECKPSTVYITVIKPGSSGRPTSNPPLTLIKSSTVTTSAIKTMSSAPYSMINSTQLNSGVGATGIPQNYKNSTASATGTGGLPYTSATIPVQPTFTGGAAIMSNQTYKVLVGIVVGVAVLARGLLI